MPRRCNTTAPRCGVCPVAAASRSKNGTCTDACRARYGGSNHHARIGKGSRASIHGQANSNMVPPDPAADEADQRLDLIVTGGSTSIWRRYQQASRALRELLPAIAAVEERKPGGARQRRNGLARKRSQRRPAHAARSGALQSDPAGFRSRGLFLPVRQAPRADTCWRGSDGRTARSPAASRSQSARSQCAAARSAATG